MIDKSNSWYDLFTGLARLLGPFVMFGFVRSFLFNFVNEKAEKFKEYHKVLIKL
jgi:hypothetical protein